eukprot:jgi/Chrzof1/7664/Cz02g32050.t1
MERKAGEAGVNAKSGGLAGWAAGKARMTTAAVTEEVNKGRPPPPKAKPQQQPKQRPRSGVAVTGRPGPPDGPVPLAKQVKDVLDFLQEGEGYPKNWEEIQERVPYYDVGEGSELRANLVSNPRVDLNHEGLAYKSEHGIRNKDDLLLYIRRHPEGTRTVDIKDAYKAVLDDIEALKADGKVYKFFNYDVQSDAVFPVDERLAIRMDPGVLELYHDITVPAEPSELAAQLAKLGQKSALANLIRKKVALPTPERKQRKRRQFQPRSVTNAHLMHLFRGDQPVSIDG